MTDLTETILHQRDPKMTLDKAKTDQIVEIKHIKGGWGIRQRLNQLGLFEGGSVKIKRGSSLGGPLVLEHNNSEIAIGRGMAAQITVRIHKNGDANS